MLAGRPIDLDVVAQSITFHNCVTQPFGISYFRKNHPVELKTLLMMIVVHGCNSFNVHTNLSEDQLAEIVGMIRSEYFYFRPEEVALVFKNAKLGQYGKVAYSIDISVIMGWFKTYAKNREEYFIGRNAEMTPDTGHANVLAYSGEMAIMKDEHGNEIEVPKEQLGQAIKDYWGSMQRVKDQQNWKEPEYKKFEAEYYARKNTNS